MSSLQIKSFLLDGVRDSFHILDNDITVTNVKEKNHVSCAVNKATEKELVDQINKGNYITATKETYCQTKEVHALAAIPKEQDKIRLIHNGSRPGQTMKNCSVLEIVKFQRWNSWLHADQLAFTLVTTV